VIGCFWPYIKINLTRFWSKLLSLFGLKFEANGERLMTLWNKAQSIPGGRHLFSHVAGRMAPYTGTIKALVEALSPGYARLSMADRKAIRNHLQSVHAVALVNFIEKTTGMAMVSQFPVGMRGIVTHIEVEFVKKARGRLSAECHAPKIKPASKEQYVVCTDVTDQEGTIVAHGRATWLVGLV
tara:strand:+ start:1314 stop:1862 length:549 start_codon:yes stop_codon:yes gene_type:complete